MYSALKMMKITLQMMDFALQMMDLGAAGFSVGIPMAVAAALKTAQGSGTVAITLTAALVRSFSVQIPSFSVQR